MTTSPAYAIPSGVCDPIAEFVRSQCINLPTQNRALRSTVPWLPVRLIRTMINSVYEAPNRDVDLAAMSSPMELERHPPFLFIFATLTIPPSQTTPPSTQPPPKDDIAYHPHTTAPLHPQPILHSSLPPSSSTSTRPGAPLCESSPFAPPARHRARTDTTCRFSPQLP